LNIRGCLNSSLSIEFALYRQNWKRDEGIAGQNFLKPYEKRKENMVEFLLGKLFFFF
jgi:hypothetical protein